MLKRLVDLFNNPTKTWVDDNKLWAEEAKKKMVHTPDMAILERKSRQPIFLCDELLPGLPKHHVIKDVAYQVAIAYTRHKYSLLRGIPLEQEFRSAPFLKIRGELHAIRSYAIPILDNLMENGVQFKRTEVQLIMPYRQKIMTTEGKPIYTQETVMLVRAWMYIGFPHYWGPQLDSGFTFPPAHVYDSDLRAVGKYSFFTEPNVKANQQPLTMQELQVIRCIT